MTTYDHASGRHDAIGDVMLYAAPHVGAEYRAEGGLDLKATRWTGDYPRCAACGKTRSIAFEVHHEPPRSKGLLHLKTPLGTSELKPSLLLLCKECHQARHAGKLGFSWAWGSAEDAGLFLSGWFFAHGYQPHDKRFWEHGRLLASFGDGEWEVRP